jgi:hypothetical protein
MAPLDRQGAEAHVLRILQERAARFAAGVEALGREMAEPIALDALEPDADSGEEAAPFQGPEFLVALVKGLSQAADQIALLDRVLEGASLCFSRACLFLVQGDSAHGWSSVGLPESEDGDPARSLRIPLSSVPLLRSAIESRATMRSEDSTEYASLLPPPVPGQRIPRTAVAAPLIVRDRVSAILYGDDGGDGSSLCDFPSAEALICVASLAADKLALEARRDSTAVVANSEVEIRIPPIAENEETEEAAAAATTELLEPDPLDEELEYAAFAREGSAGPADLSAEETRLHDDARRFARLLVSELLLYNEDVVVAGRRQRDIYDRLKDEIDRSRQAYDQRIPAPVRSRTDYFKEELIRTLAQGDALALGSF